MEKFESRDLGYLGLVAAICDEIGIVEIIDRLIPPDPRSTISIGESVKLMIINGLGFTSKPLYLESMYFQSRPVSHLLGRELESEEISDDRLGRALNKCYEADCNKVFATVARKALTKFGVNQRFKHLDTTSMNVQGEIYCSH